MGFSAPERSTTFNSDDEFKTWSGCSCQPAVISKLRRAGIEPYKVDSDGMAWYKDIAFNQISFRSKSERKRVMTEEHKQRLLESRKKR